MKILIKLITIIIIILTIPISIYYGLRIKNTPFLLEYINRSYVITLPNKVWFEINGAMDTLDDEPIFENDSPEIEKSGLDFGLQYPKYHVKTENNTATKTETSTRVGDTITLQQNILFEEDRNGEYITKIFFSQYGNFRNNTFSKDGCEVKITSEEGIISYDEQYSITKINYEAIGKEINDTITFEITCL